MPSAAHPIGLVGFDGDDTLWRSEDFYQQAHGEFERVLERYLDLADVRIHDRLLATEKRNIALFGYGAKGMTLSMVETAIELTEGRISAADLHRVVELGKAVLRHPVELLPGVREAVEAVAACHPVVLITKGDLFHQEDKVARSGLADLFHRIEIVSEKDAGRYARVLREFGQPASGFAMVGNSLRSDIDPVVRLGGWGIHIPYRFTWAHEMEHALAADEPRCLTIADASQVPAALAEIERRAAA